MSEICLNCKNEVTNNFCGHCGQKKFKRIDKKYIWDEIQYTVLHTNKGFLYSIKKILKNPGQTAREFIDGNRVNHYKPILLVFVLSGISTFLSYKVLNLKEVMADYFLKQKMNSNMMSDMMTFLSSYNSLLMLLAVPVFALFTKIAFRKWGHNYYEHVVMNAYILSFYVVVSILLVYPIMFVFRKSPAVFFNVSSLSMLLVPIILIWFFKSFYSEKLMGSILLRILGVLGLTLLGYFVLIFIGVIIAVAWATANGMDVMKYIQPK